MEMRQKIAFCCLIFFLFISSEVNWAQNLKTAEVVIILNMARQRIQSGELSVTYEKVYILSDEAIKKRRQNYEEDFKNPSIHELNHKGEIFSYHLRKEQVTQEKRNVFFEVDTGSPALRVNHYKSIILDRRPLNPLKGVGPYASAGYCKVLSYDGQLGAIETDSRFVQSTIGLHDTTPITDESGLFHLFGKSFRHIPADSQVDFAWKTVGGKTRGVVRFSTDNRLIKLLVNPNQEFAVLREEHFIGNSLVFSADYQSFSEKNSIFYPTNIELKWYNDSILKKKIKYEVKEMSFNLDFPPDFFRVQRILPSGQILSPYSPITAISQVEPVDTQLAQKVPLPMCGPLSFQFVCEKFNIKTELDELLKLTGYKEDIGTSMKGLYDAALKKGLNPEGVLMRSKRLKDLRLPVIAHIDRNHFVVVTAISKREVHIFDPASDEVTLPIDDFKKRWDGSLLTFSPPSGSVTPPGELAQQSVHRSTTSSQIQVVQAEHDFGRIRGGQKVEHIFTVKNVGKVPLAISQTESSCGCTTAFLSNPIIPPGKDLQVKVEFDVPQKEGNDTQFVRFQTNDLNRPTLELKVKADVYLPLKAVPRQVYFGKILSNTRTVRVIEINYSLKQVQILGIRTDSDVVRATLLDDKRHLEISANFPTAGLIDEKVFIDYREEDERLELEIPIRGQVLGNFKISPNSIFFGAGNAKANILSREVVVTATQPNLRILRAESQSNFVSTEITSLKENGKYKIRISLDAANTGGFLKDIVTLYTNSEQEPKLEIPVYTTITKLK